MLSTKPVLPNFLKTLVIATMAGASVSAFAGHHEGAEEKVVDLKDLKAKSTELKTDELTSSLSDEADSAKTSTKTDAKTKEEMADKVLEAKPDL